MKSKVRLHGLQYIGRDARLSADLRRAGEMPLHSHDYFELEILLEGSGKMELNSRSLELSPGCVYFLTPADFHEVHLSSENLLWNISFDGSVFAPERLPELFLPNCFFGRADGETLEKLDAAARLLSRETHPEGQRLLTEYLLRTAGILREPEGEPSPIRRALSFVETFFREDPSLADAAARAGMSPSYFGARFREETGETYVSYLNRCKVNCAAMLLRSGASVTEACFESGFGSLSGFRYAFRRYLGVSPQEYARSAE